MTENKRYKNVAKDDSVVIQDNMLHCVFVDCDDIVEVLNEKEALMLHYEKRLSELQMEIDKLSVMKSKGLKILEFYEDKLKHADKKEFKNAREELWIVKEVLCEMRVIKDD